MQTKRASYYGPKTLYQSVEEKVKDATRQGEAIDYLAFVPDGEPTLDVDLGQAIDLLKPLGIKIAVISNASLIWKTEVQDALSKADWVSLKIDAVEDSVWRRVDRPHKALDLDSILIGMEQFASDFEGDLMTETLLVRGLNDGEDHLTTLANQLGRIAPTAAYLSIATRPPAEAWVRAPSEDTIQRAYHILNKQVKRVEYLIGYEGDAFAFTGNVQEDLLSITSVHPMRKEAIDAFLVRAGETWEAVQPLIDQDQWVKTDHEGHTYYMRRLAVERNP